MGRIGMTEMLILVAVALLLFGGGKIADMGKGLGEGIKNFKKGLSGDDDDRAAPPAPKDDGVEKKLTP
ncbi:MAG: twin-arginine translocase TatA/TatE family subunit [Polyangiaceae bacterium]